jgi:hypothetical protein
VAGEGAVWAEATEETELRTDSAAASERPVLVRPSRKRRRDIDFDR